MQLVRISVLSLKVHVVSFQEIIALIESWIFSDHSHTVCLSNVHMCMEVYDPKFKAVA